MAWIRELSREEAVRAFPPDAVGPIGPHDEGPLVQMWEDGAHAPSILTVYSLIPELMLAQMKFGPSITRGGSGLGRRIEELIATQVSGLLGCLY